MPEFDNIRILHGAIFLRKGLYRDGIFRFTIKLPLSYNSFNSHPVINFQPPIFHPLVNAETGELDLKSDATLTEWEPDKHYIVTALIFIKKIFYLKSFEQYTITNTDALIL